MFALSHQHKKILALLSALLALLAFAAAPARADRRDHDLARQALQDGVVLSLRAILDIVEREYPGQIMEVEFEHDDGRFVYELKVLQSRGRLVKLKLDARSGAVIKSSSKREKPVEKSGDKARDDPRSKVRKK